jgi:hypothetical protein
MWSGGARLLDRRSGRASSGCATRTRTPSPRRHCCWRSTSCTATAGTSPRGRYVIAEPGLRMLPRRATWCSRCGGWPRTAWRRGGRWLSAYEGCVAKDEASVDDGGARGGGVQQKELHGSRKDRWLRRILGEDTPDRQSGGGRVRLLALSCAERTRQAARESCAVLEARNENSSEDRRLHGTTRKTEGRLVTGPRLLICRRSGALSVSVVAGRASSCETSADACFAVKLAVRPSMTGG